MTKNIENLKIKGKDGCVTYVMRRVFEVAVMTRPFDPRDAIAFRLRQARRELRKAIEQAREEA